MVALRVNGEPILIASITEVNKRIEDVKSRTPDADIEKHQPVGCGACGSLYFDQMEAISCGCHDYY